MKRILFTTYFISMISGTTILAQFTDVISSTAEYQAPTTIEKNNIGDLSFNTGYDTIPTATFAAVDVLNSASVAEEDIHKIAIRYLHIPLTKERQIQFLTEVRALYTQKGYPLTTLEFKTDHARREVLTLVVKETYIHDIYVEEAENDENKDRITSGVLSDFFEESYSMVGGLVNSDRLQHYSDLFNDLKNVYSEVLIRPTHIPNAVDIIYKVDEADDNSNYVAVDNLGQGNLGDVFYNLHLEEGNLLNLGEAYELDLVASDDDLYSVEFNFKTPTMFNETFIKAGFHYDDYVLRPNTPGVSRDGEVYEYYLAASKVLRTNQNEYWTMDAGIRAGEYRLFNDDVISVEDDTTRAYLNTYYFIRDKDARVPWTAAGIAEISRGIDLLGLNERGNSDASIFNGETESTIFTSTIYLEGSITPRDKLSFKGRVQWADNELVSSDLYYIGGYSTVRGFDPAYSAAESGQNFSLSYGHDFDIDQHEITLGAFYDYGHIEASDHSLLGNTEDTLESAGVFLDAELELIDLGSTRGRVDVAWPIGSYDDDDVDDYRIYFRLRQEF